MDILEKKSKTEFDSKVLNVVKKLQFKNFPVDFKGSSSLKSQIYFSDYDLMTNIVGKVSQDEAYRVFYKILQNVLNDSDTYFEEFKIEDKKGNKYRWFPNETFDKDEFIKVYKEIDFAKLDIILWIENRFVEMSIIYQFSDKELSKEEYIKGLNEDINELKKEGNNFKILKRKFNIFKVERNKEKLLFLTVVFNSELGALYQKLSNLEAIKKVSEDYKDKLTKDRIKLNLKEIKSKSINEISKIKNELNKKTKDIVSKI